MAVTFNGFDTMEEQDCYRYRSTNTMHCHGLGRTKICSMIAVMHVNVNSLALFKATYC